MARDQRPNFYILGAAKAGTTTLYDLLDQHPQVYLPYDKEPAYFCDDEYYARGSEWYLGNFFSGAAGQTWRGEATSRYLYFGSKVANRIRQFHPQDEPKFIAIFRDPTRLVHSFYWHSIREGTETLPVADALAQEEQRLAQQGQALEARGQILYAYHRIGNYASQLQPYLDTFPRQNFLFLLTEDLYDMDTLRAKLATFFGLDPFPAQQGQAVHSNSAALPRMRWLHNFLRHRSGLKDLLKPLIPNQLRFAIKDKVLTSNLKAFSPPALDPAIEADLRAHYRGQVLALQGLIGRDLSSWLEPK